MPQFVTYTMINQEQFSLNAWYGIIGSLIVGSFSSHRTLTTERYLNFLRPDLLIFLKNVNFNQIDPLFTTAELYQYSKTQCLNIDGYELLGWYLGLEGLRSDLTPPDTPFWGYVSNAVYATKSRT